MSNGWLKRVASALMGCAIPLWVAHAELLFDRVYVGYNPYSMSYPTEELVEKFPLIKTQSLNYQQGLLLGLSSKGVVVNLVGDAVDLVIPAERLFQPGSFELESSGSSLLLQITALIRSFGSPSLSIQGYTDQVGTSSEKLSGAKKEAEAVAAFLWAQGISQEQMNVRGMMPHLVAQDPLAGMNRRVEIRFIHS